MGRVTRIVLPLTARAAVTGFHPTAIDVLDSSTQLLPEAAQESTTLLPT